MNYWPIVMVGLAGFLGAGAFAFARDGHRLGAVVLGFFTLLAVAGAVVWWI